MKESISIGTNGGLVKFETVLDRQDLADYSEYVTYKSDPEGRQVWITFPRADYVELGEPVQVTVQVRPGNALEAELASDEK